jgi:hypothetical protein
MSEQFSVLNPWAEVDPVPMRGITPRVSDLNGKKIGLLYNGKRASQPILTVVERKLKALYPAAKFSYFGPTGNQEVTGSPLQPAFEAWVKSVDTVVSAVGD